MISLFSCFLGSQPTSDKSSQRPSESTNCSPARKRSSSESTSSPGTCCSFEETRLSLVNRRTRGSHRPRRGAGVDVDAQHSAAGQGRAEHRGGGGCSAQRSHAGLRPPPLHVQPADTSHPGQDWPLSTHPSRFVLPTYTRGPFPIIPKPAPPHSPGFSGLKSDSRTSTSPLPPSQSPIDLGSLSTGLLFSPLSGELSPFHLKEAPRGLPSAYPSRWHRCSWAVGSLFSRAVVTLGQRRSVETADLIP